MVRLLRETENGRPAIYVLLAIIVATQRCSLLHPPSHTGALETIESVTVMIVAVSVEITPERRLIASELSSTSTNFQDASANPSAVPSYFGGRRTTLKIVPKFSAVAVATLGRLCVIRRGCFGPRADPGEFRSLHYHSSADGIYHCGFVRDQSKK